MCTLPVFLFAERLLTSEAVSPNNRAFIFTLRGEYLDINPYGALIPTESSTIITGSIINHESVNQE